MIRVVTILDLLGKIGKLEEMNIFNHYKSTSINPYRCPNVSAPPERCCQSPIFFSYILQENLGQEHPWGAATFEHLQTLQTLRAFARNESMRLRCWNDHDLEGLTCPRRSGILLIDNCPCQIRRHATVKRRLTGLTNLSPCGSCGYQSAKLKGPWIVLIVLNGLLIGFIFGYILRRSCTMISTTRAVLAPPATVSMSFCRVLLFFTLWSPTVRGMHAGAKGSAVPSLTAPVAAVPVALGRMGHLLAAISLAALWGRLACGTAHVW